MSASLDSCARRCARSFTTSVAFEYDPRQHFDMTLAGGRFQRQEIESLENSGSRPHRIYLDKACVPSIFRREQILGQIFRYE